VQVLGIDIGGSGIKGALVDVERGTLRGERVRIATPDPSKPPAVARVVREIAASFGWRGAIGCTFPAIVKQGVAHSASNVDAAWIGTDAAQLFRRATRRPVTVLNDADAAGLAEMRFGAGRAHRGVVLVFGTGIGSALFLDGKLVPNTELGHVEMDGVKAEWRASDRVRKAKHLSWKRWARRLDEYLQHLDLLFSPDLIIVGGGVSKQHDHYLHRLKVKAPVVPAALRNEAGIVGAALAAANGRAHMNGAPARQPKRRRRASQRRA
jgi:polyphosphate glucokinase